MSVLKLGESSVITHRLECRCLALSRRDVIDHKSTRSLGCVLIVEQFPIGDLRNTLVSTVASLEIHICGPVIAQLNQWSQHAFERVPQQPRV
jgi:predicted glycosyltransferase